MPVTRACPGNDSLPPSTAACCLPVQDNVAAIAAHNARGEASYTLGLNPHADLTTEEFRLRYFGARWVVARWQTLGR